MLPIEIRQVHESKSHLDAHGMAQVLKEDVSYTNDILHQTMYILHECI